MLRLLTRCLPPMQLVCNVSARLYSTQSGSSNKNNNSANFSSSSSPSSSSSLEQSEKLSEYFDGNFTGGLPFIDNSLLSQMQERVRTAMTPEMQESISSFMQGNNLQDLMKSGPHGKMGMMAFGLGENEKGKKVARAAQVMCDLETGKVHKDFTETQLEADDISLPKETVENYDTEGAMEVQFVEDVDKVEAGTSTEKENDTLNREHQCVSENEIEVETVEINDVKE